MTMIPICVFEDRYSGTYSGGAWIAVAMPDKSVGRHYRSVLTAPTHFHYAFDGTHNTDLEAAKFGRLIEVIPWIAVGSTPDEAVRNLKSKAGAP